VNRPVANGRPQWRATLARLATAIWTYVWHSLEAASELDTRWAESRSEGQAGDDLDRLGS